MGEAPWEKHFLLRRTGDDGPAEGSLLPDPVPHRRDLLTLLRFRVSRFLSPWVSNQDLLQREFKSHCRAPVSHPKIPNICETAGSME